MLTRRSFVKVVGAVIGAGAGGYQIRLPKPRNRKRSTDQGRGYDMVTLTREPGGTPPPPPTGVTVTSVVDMLSALADPTIYPSIILADGTYSVSTMLIDASVNAGYARTAANAVIVRAATDGGVTFDGGGAAFNRTGFNPGYGGCCFPFG